jgi:hypothetical protein
MLVFGMIGNCLNIYIFTRHIYRNTTSVHYLLACSVASCIQLIHTLLLRILSDGFHIYIATSNHYYCRIRNLISAVTSLCGISYPCWASFGQFISTSRNAATRVRWSSKQFVNRAIFCTILFWLIVYLPNSIFTQASGTICIINNKIIIFTYSYVIIPITYCMLPVISFTYFNIGIVKNLRYTTAVLVSNSNKRMARHVQQMLVPQLIILILSGIPFTLQTLYSTSTIFISKDANRIAIENLISHITRLLFYLNYVSSFYIYALMSREFRTIVQSLFKKRNTSTSHTTIVVV